MALPALRQPKCFTKLPEKSKSPSKTPKFLAPDASYLILTLKDSKKLVVTSDAYHGITKAVDVYECLFCASTMRVDEKELHKRSNKHRIALDAIPFNDDLSENLIRQISFERAYCTLCHAVVSTRVLTRHLTSEAHCSELARAAERARTYKPSS